MLILIQDSTGHLKKASLISAGCVQGVLDLAKALKACFHPPELLHIFPLWGKKGI